MLRSNVKAGPGHLEDEGVGGNADMEGIGLGPALPLEPPLTGTAIVGQQLEGWAPLFELHLPVEHDRGGDNHKVRSPIAPAWTDQKVLLVL